MLLSSVLTMALSLSGAVHSLNLGMTREDQLFSSFGLNNDGSPIDPQTDLLRRDEPAAEKLAAEYVTLPLDHFDGDEGTFRNRYWLSDTNYRPGGPVMIYDVGEQEADGFEAALQRGVFYNLLKQFNGIGIVWEHRYYGKSVPVPINNKTPATAFKHLTTEQALADVASLAWNFSRPNFPKVDLTPRGTPWVFVGGSYPGMRAAFFRHLYPGTIFASWASSAPVQASVDMSFYFEPIWRGMNKFGWGNCTNDIHAAILEVDRQLGDSAAASTLKDRFLGKGASGNSNGGFADALSTIFWNWQSYNVDGGVGALRSFCNWIAFDETTNQTSPAEGWAATKGVDFTLKRWLSWPEWVTTVNLNMGTNCTGPAAGAPPNQTAIADAVAKGLFKPIKKTTCDLDSAGTDPSGIAWTWQYCTQWGFLQYANVGDHQLVSAASDLQHTLDYCQKQFPDGKASGLLPDVPAVEETNEKLGGWNIRPSQTFWTGGEFDPWRTLSPLSDMPFAPKAISTQTIPECAAPAPPSHGHEDDDNEDEEEEDESDAEAAGQNTPLFSYLLPNSEHCYDLDLGARGGMTGAPARTLFSNALSQWLKCFKPGLHAPGYRSAGKKVAGVRRALFP